jgi:hypothetical protein
MEHRQPCKQHGCHLSGVVHRSVLIMPLLAVKAGQDYPLCRRKRHNQELGRFTGHQ